MQRSGTSVKSVFLSILLHLGAAALLVVSIDMNTRTFRNTPTEVVQAVTIDSKEVEKELQKLQEIDKQKQKKQEEAEQKLKEAEQKLAAARQQRKEEEDRVTEAKKKQEQEQLKQKEAEQKLAAIKEQEKKLEEKRQHEEAEKKAAETERQHKEQEAAKQKQLAEKQKAEAAAQAQQDQQFINNFSAEIKRRVSNNFNISGLPPGLKCIISVRVIPGGEIVNASISRTSGNEIFDNRALVAVQKASPLPVPPDAASLDRLKLRQFSFEFSP